MKLFRCMRSPNLFEACNRRRESQRSRIVGSYREGCSPCATEESIQEMMAQIDAGLRAQANQRLLGCLGYGK